MHIGSRRAGQMSLGACCSGRRTLQPLSHPFGVVVCHEKVTLNLSLIHTAWMKVYCAR